MDITTPRKVSSMTSDNLMDLLHRANVDKESLRRENAQLRTTLFRALAELCKICGRLPDEPLGACDRCPWNPVNKGKLI